MNHRKLESFLRGATCVGVLAALSSCSPQMKAPMALAVAQTAPVEAAVIELVPQSGHIGPVGAAVLTPDGRLLITGGRDGALKFWLTASGELLRSEQATTNLPGDVAALAVSPDGKILASATADGELRLWNIADGTPFRTLKASRGSFYYDQTSPVALCFAADGKTLLAGSDKTLRWWDVATGKLKLARPLYADSLCAALSPDGQKLALAIVAPKWGVQLWDVGKGTRLRTLGQAVNGRTPPVLAFAPDGNTLYCAAETVTAWNLEDGSPKKVFPRPKSREQETLKQPSIGTHWDFRFRSIPSFAVSPDGALAARLLKNELRIWNMQTGEDVSPAASPEPSPGAKGMANEQFRALFFSPDGKMLSSINKSEVSGVAGGIGKIQLWDTASGALRWTNTSRSGIANKVSLASAGKTMACSTIARSPETQFSTTFEVWQWDMQAGTPRRAIPQTQYVAGLALSPDGKNMAVGNGGDGKLVAVVRANGKVNTNVEGSRGAAVRWWDVAGGQLQHQVFAHHEAADALVFSPDGKTLTSGGGSLYQGEIAQWDVVSGNLKKRWEGHPDGGVIALACSPNGELLASGSWDNSVRLWDARGNLKRTFKLVGGWVFAVAFSPDGRTLCTGTGGGDNEGWCTLFNLSNGKMIWERKLKTDIYNVSFSPDGAKLLVSSGKNVALWDAKHGTIQRTLSNVSGKALFSPDGRFIVGLHDGGLTLCDARDGKLRASLLLFGSDTATPQWLAYTPDGFYDGSPGMEKLLRWRVSGELQAVSLYPERRRVGLLGQVWKQQAQVAKR